MRNDWTAGALLAKRALRRVPALLGLLAIGLVVPATGALAAPTPAARPATGTCSAAGSTGLTAAMVATANVSNIDLNATGCDVGIYVPPGTSGITISGVTVTGANDHGIFVQDASGITITGSTVTGNGVAPTSGIDENKAVELVGTTNSTVSSNSVTGNLADGGIGIADDSPSLDPGAPTPSATSPLASSGDVVTGNTVSGNYAGCGIVLAAYDPGAGLANDTVSDNQVLGSPGVFGPHGPVVGSIVVAADEPATSVEGISVTGNTVSGGFIPLVVHSNAPHDVVSNVSITNNTITGNDWGAVDGPPKPAAIIVAASPIPPPVTPTITGTTITGNTISGDFYGVWIAGATGTTTSPDTYTVTPGGASVFDVPVPGAGYWQAAADGGVFAFGDAGFYGSMGGQHLNAPMVGIAPTMDQGGYWEAAADGGVFAFGDATFYGSMGGKPLNAPIVGVAATPYAVPPGQTQGTPAGKGYWEVAADGGIFAFGDAGFYGSMGGKPLNAPIVGIAPTSDGHGYWEVAADGGVFAFGDAGFYGSMGGQHLNAPIVGIAATPDGKGYWEVAADGGVFAFGDAGFYGSMGGKHLNAPIVAIATTPDGHGYWEVAADGGVFAFGDAGFDGSMGGKPLNAPIVATAPVGVTLAA